MSTPGEFFAAFEEAAQADPDAATQPDAVFKFVLSGENGGTWTLNLKRGTRSAFVSTGGGPKEDASIHVASDDWIALTTGKINPMRAFMSGKIRVDGDLKLAVNLPNVVNMVEGYGIGARSPISAAFASARGALSAITGKRPSINPDASNRPGEIALDRCGARAAPRSHRVLREAVDVELSGLGESGAIELFAFTKRLAHRMGLASWGGMIGASEEQLDALAAHFEQLDSSESFVHPRKALLAIATRKRRERRAMHAIEAIFADILCEREPSTDANSSDLFSRICASWDDVPSPTREIGIARDVIVVQMGSQSNLFAAMAWTLIFALRHPAIVDQIRAENDSVLDPFSHEAIRMSQRSIVLRRVVSPIEIADEHVTYQVEPGTLIATMLSVANQSAAKGLDKFNEKNYRGSTFLRAGDLPARELVTTYGHGKHTCPAHRFSTSAIRHSVGEIFRRYELTAQFDQPHPLRRQIGGVARADRPCVVHYVARS